MSLADEVLANHIKDGADCLICMFPWPCAAVRLATQLRAAEKVVEAARDVQKLRRQRSAVRTNDESADWLYETAKASEKLSAALAEYDKGGQG